MSHLSVTNTDSTEEKQLNLRTKVLKKHNDKNWSLRSVLDSSICLGQVADGAAPPRFDGAAPPRFDGAAPPPNCRLELNEDDGVDRRSYGRYAY
jgi:hypothetical protein